MSMRLAWEWRWPVWGFCAPVMTALLAYVLLGERLTIAQLVGGALILLAVVSVQGEEQSD